MEKHNIIANAVSRIEVCPGALALAELRGIAHTIYDVCGKKGFIVPFESVFCQLKLKNRKATLHNFRNKYKEGVHYIVKSERQKSGQDKKFYFLTAKCFQDMCLKIDTTICTQVRELYILVLEGVKNLQEKIDAGKIVLIDRASTGEITERPLKRLKTANASSELMAIKVSKKNRAGSVMLRKSIAGPTIHNDLNKAWNGCTRKLLGVRLDDPTINVSDHESHVSASFKTSCKVLLATQLRRLQQSGVHVDSKAAIEQNRANLATMVEMQAQVRDLGLFPTPYSLEQAVHDKRE